MLPTSCLQSVLTCLPTVSAASLSRVAPLRTLCLGDWVAMPYSRLVALGTGDTGALSCVRRIREDLWLERPDGTAPYTPDHDDDGG